VAAADIRARLAAIPGVDEVGLVRMVPLEGGGLGLGGLRTPGSTGRNAQIDTDWNVISPEYLRTVGIPVLRGRDFTAVDDGKAPWVAIVNEHFAQLVWPGRDPIGQRLETGDFRNGHGRDVHSLTIVGVARDAKYRWIGEAPAPFIYVPYAQHAMAEMNYLLRRAQALPAGASLVPQVRQTVRGFDANLPLVRMQPLRQSADLGLLPQHLVASVAGLLGAPALLLAGIGIYGVTAFSAASRSREFGLRMALGADRSRILRLVIGQGVRLCAMGAAIGIALSIGVTRLLSSLLFGVSPLDPVTYAGTVILLAAVAIVATIAPARRAAAINPLATLKAE